MFIRLSQQLFLMGVPPQSFPLAASQLLDASLSLAWAKAMMRYVAQRGKLWGSTPEESAIIDMVAEGIKDARTIVVSYPFTPEKASQAVLQTSTEPVAVPQAMLTAELPARLMAIP